MNGEDPHPSRLAPGGTARHHRSMLWAQVVRVACKIVSVVVLARLVSPADHGLFAMAASVTLFLLLFRDAGLGTAAVQAASLSAAQLSALLFTHVALGVLLAALTLLLAPLAASFYDSPGLLPLLATMSVAFVFIGIGGFPRNQLMRELRFAELARIDALTALSGTAAMIAAGTLGLGAYSFAVFLLVTEGLAAALAWRAYPWQYDTRADFRSLRHLLQTGAHITGYQTVNQLTSQLDTLAIGHLFGAHPLGLYYRPAQLLALGNQHVVSPLVQVSLATLSRLAADSDRFQREVRHTVTVTAHLSWPLATFCLSLPYEMIRLALGRQWTDAADILRWLALVSATSLVTLIAFGVNVAAGQSRRLLVSALAWLPLTALAITFGARHGAVGVAAALALINLLSMLPRLGWMLRGTPVGVAVFLSALAGPLAINVALGLGLAGGRLCASDAAWPMRLVSGAIGGVAAVGLLLALSPRLRREIRELLAHLPRFPTGAA